MKSMQKPLIKLNYSNSIHFVTKSTPFQIKHPMDRRCSRRDSRRHTKHSIDSDAYRFQQT